MNVMPGVIPKEALAVLAAGFGRHNDHWVESIARSFLEMWQGALVDANYMTPDGEKLGTAIVLPVEVIT